MPAVALLLAAVVVTMAPRPGHAQSASPAPDARAAFERGVRALDEGRYRDAVDALEQSRSIREVPAANYNLGLAYRGVGDLIAAIAAFERFLAAHDAHSGPEEIAQVRRAVEELRAELASLELHAQPSTAMVTIDGRPVSSTGSALAINPGSHVIEVRADGFEADRREISLGHGQRQRIDIVLHASISPAHLIVEPSVASAVVTIDNVRQPTSTVDLVVAPGPHDVSIQAQGYARFERRVNVAPNAHVRVEAHLSRAGGVGWAVPVGIGVGVLAVAGVIVGVVIAGQPRQGDLSSVPHTIDSWGAR